MRVQPDDDYKRVGLFLGHELFINKMSVMPQLGYLRDYPFDFEGKVYNRNWIKADIFRIRYIGR